MTFSALQMSVKAHGFVPANLLFTDRVVRFNKLNYGYPFQI